MSRMKNALTRLASGAGNDSWIDGPLSVECILPAQFNARGANRSGEERLMVAVLEDAINCFFGKDTQATLEAVWWFKSRGDASPFCFENVCHALAINSSWLRRGLFRQRALLKKESASSVAAMPLSRAA